MPEPVTTMIATQMALKALGSILGGRDAKKARKRAAEAQAHANLVPNGGQRIVPELPQPNFAQVLGSGLDPLMALLLQRSGGNALPADKAKAPVTAPSTAGSNPLQDLMRILRR